MLKKISLVLFLITLSTSVGLAETITLANQGTYVGCERWKAQWAGHINLSRW